MAYIQPNTRVLLLTGVPLDETYEHTIYFSNINAQTNYFLGQKKYEFTPQTYQRKGIGYIKVNQRPELLYDCNYLMFQNTSYGNKWFYAFVLDVEYVNDVTAIVSYQIDWLQTWWFDLTIHDCWVDREHIAVDAIGASLTEENLDIGQLECIYSTTPFKSARVGGTKSVRYSYYLVIVSTDNSVVPTETYHARRLTKNNGLISLYSACDFLLFTNEQDAQGLVMDYINDLADHDKLDSIVNIFMCPTGYIEAYEQGGYPEFMFQLGTSHIYPEYTVKNKKCLQYPYRFINVHTQDGDDIPFRFEYWQNPEGASFKQGLVISPTPDIYAYPLNYNTDKIDADPEFMLQYGYENMIIAGSIPQVAFTTDSYRVWLAQNSTWLNGRRVSGSEIMSPSDMIRAGLNLVDSTMAGAFGGGKFAPTTVSEGIPTAVPTGGTFNGAIDTVVKPNISSVKNAGAGMAIGAGIGAAHSLANTGAKVLEKVSAREKAMLIPPKYHSGNGYLQNQINKQGATFTVMCMREVDAKRIDDFFEMYGYKTNELKIPNTHSRPHWNYVKTSMANITGNIPSTDLANIKAIFNNGITFWKHANEVGNYSLNNH